MIAPWKASIVLAAGLVLRGSAAPAEVVVSSTKVVPDDRVSGSVALRDVEVNGGDVSGVLGRRRIGRQREPRAIRFDVGHGHDDRIARHRLAIDRHAQRDERRVQQMAHGPAVVRQPSPPPGARLADARLHLLLDLHEQPEALLAEEQLAVADADVDVDELSVLHHVDRPLHTIRLPELTREEIAEARGDRQERHRPPDGGQGGGILRAVAADTDQEREALAVQRGPAAQAIEVGEDLEPRPVSPGAQGVAQPASPIERAAAA